MNEEIVMYILMRDDLNMSRGKMCAQAGHGVFYATSTGEFNMDGWLESGTKKIILAVSREELMDKMDELEEAEIRFRAVIDHGLTEIEPNTVTCIATVPLRKSIVSSIFGNLPLLK